jgi:hypothetical protein
MVRASIWKDTFYYSSENSLTYYITTQGQTIFAGRAYRLPSASQVKISVSSICRNYLSNDLRPLLDAYFTDDITESESPTSLQIFYLYDSQGVLLETYEFLYDWSYENNYNGSDMILSRAINGRTVPNMFTPITVIEKGKVYNKLFDDIGYYKNVDACNAEYALYYSNVYGGWDAFLFEGYCTKEDNIKQFTTEKAAVNNTLDYELERYTSEINTSYILRTGWLTDEQANNFVKNLIGSNHVYLHDLKADKIYSAIIVDTRAEYKKMKTNNGKMLLYSINVKQSQNKLRR